MREPQFSVVIPTYRRERLLVETLESVFAQEGCRLEIIVVDQTPAHEFETEAFLHQAQDGGKLKWLRTSPPTVTRARNIGMSNASFEVILFLDDDVLLPHPLICRTLMEDFTDPRVLGVGAAIVNPGEDPDVAKRKFIEHLQVRHPFHHPFLVPVHSVFGGFMAFRRDTFVKWGGFDEAFARYPQEHSEEVEFCWRISAKGRTPVLFCDQRLWFWHRSGSGGHGTLEATPTDAWLRTRMEAAWYAYLRTPPGGPVVRLIRGAGFFGRAYAFNRGAWRQGPARVLRNLRHLVQAYLAARKRLPYSLIPSFNSKHAANRELS